MREASGPLWADRAFLRDIQYADDRNLAARQSIYAYCEHKADLPALVIGSLDLGGHEVVADVGCGNGLYLAELASHGHRAPAAGWICRRGCSERRASGLLPRGWPRATRRNSRCVTEPATSRS